tara:strand:+ start:66 stop:404 length:339 start_codon:yes stop_codon:yes gene_type:complete
MSLRHKQIYKKYIMETIITVLITLGVVALVAAVWGVVRLKRRVDDLELSRLEFIDELSNTRKDLYDEMQGLNNELQNYISTSESNLDRRFDNVWGEVHKLDRTLNPNKDLLT